MVSNPQDSLVLSHVSLSRHASSSVKSKLVLMSSASPLGGRFSVAASLILASFSFRSLSVEIRDVHVHLSFVL